MKNFSLILIAIPAGLCFFFLFLTRSGYLTNDFFQKNHIVLAIIFLVVAFVIFKLNYKPKNKKQ